MHKRCATSSLFSYYYYSYSRYGMGTGICPSGLLLKLLGRYRLRLVSLGANTQDAVVLDPVAALGGGWHGPGGREAGLPLADQARAQRTHRRDGTRCTELRPALYNRCRTVSVRYFQLLKRKHFMLTV